MARIRTIKPDFPEDDRLVTISVSAIALFLLMKPFCDDKGIITANDRLIKSKCFPQRDDIRLSHVSQWIKELKENSLLVLLSYGGKDYYALDFSAERIDKPQPSIIADENFLNEKLLFGQIREDSRTFENVPAGEEGKGIGNGEGEEGGEPPQKKIDFEKFWDEYDKKVGEKVKLQKKWDSLDLDIQQKIIDYLPDYKKSQPDKQFRKNPETFLNNKGWEDEIIFENPQKKLNATHQPTPNGSLPKQQAGAVAFLNRGKERFGA